MTIFNATLTFYSKVEIIIDESDIDYVFKLICITVIRNIQESLGKGSTWIIHSIISVFRYENKAKYPIYLSKKCCEDKDVDLLLIGEGEKKHYVFNKDCNTFMYDHTLHRGKKKILTISFGSF